MDISEKILNLRKNHNLTQEELAEKLNVSRQSISKWESGQAVPEVDKVLMLGEVFHVTTDYLLKPSEIDELTLKTEVLERQQEELKKFNQRQKTKSYRILSCVAIYLVAFAFIMLINRISWEVDIIWRIFPGLTLHFIIFLLATALSIFVCLRHGKASKEKES